jgi:membrane protein
MFHFQIINKSKIIIQLLRKSFTEFQQNDPLRMAAATSFFATFALPPILIILIEVFGVFTNPRTIRQNLFQQLSHAIDPKTVVQIRETLRNVRYLPLTWYAQAAGFIFLLFVASTLFTVIKGSLNQVWNIKLKKNNSIAFILFYRIKSIGLIIAAGILFLIVVMADTKGLMSYGHNKELAGGYTMVLQKLVYNAASMFAAIAWFILILKFLGDGRPRWGIAVTGGFFTGVLFTAGKLLLHFLLLYNKVQTIYGASTSIVLLLLFIFYSSFIFYFGASFTKILAEHNNHPIMPTIHAMRYTLKRVEQE